MVSGQVFSFQLYYICIFIYLDSIFPIFTFVSIRPSITSSTSHFSRFLVNRLTPWNICYYQRNMDTNGIQLTFITHNRYPYTQFQLLPFLRKRSTLYSYLSTRFLFDDTHRNDTLFNDSYINIIKPLTHISTYFKKHTFICAVFCKSCTDLRRA